MFGLTEGSSARGGSSRGGKAKGVVLVRGPRKVSWLAGWTSNPGAATPSSNRAAAPSVVPGPAATRNRT